MPRHPAPSSLRAPRRHPVHNSCSVRPLPRAARATAGSCRSCAGAGRELGRSWAGVVPELGRSCGRRHGVGEAVPTSPAPRSAPAQLLHYVPPRPSGRQSDTVPPELCRGPTAAQRRGGMAGRRRRGAACERIREGTAGRRAELLHSVSFRPPSPRRQQRCRSYAGVTGAARPPPPTALPELCGVTAAASQRRRRRYRRSHAGVTGAAGQRHRHSCRSHAGAAGTEEGRMPMASAPLGFSLSAGRR